MDLEDLSKKSIGEIDENSIVPKIVDGYKIVFNPNSYEDRDGIRWFFNPLKIDSGILACNILDRVALIKNTDFKEVYLYAFSITSADNGKIGRLMTSDTLEKGYSVLNGLSRSDVHCIG